MSDTTAPEDDELRLVGPIVAITALALAAIVLTRQGLVPTFWWMLMLAVAAPATLELALEWRRRRHRGDRGPQTIRPDRSRPAPEAAGFAVAPYPVAAVPEPAAANPRDATMDAAPLTSSEEVTQPRRPAVPPVDPTATRGADAERVLERTRVTPSTSITAIQVPKSTNDLTTCEDAVDTDPSGLIVAVSDGASSAFMSRTWARVLVSGFVAQPLDPNLDALQEWSSLQSERWARAVADASGGRDADEWWNEASTDRGSSATILGLRLVPRPSGFRWSAIAVGDTVVAQVRPNPVDGGVALIRSFPIEGAETFDATPELLPTTSSEDVADLPALRFAEGTAEPGDSLLIMTDALAQWALRNDTVARPPWAWLLEVGGTQLERAVTACRNDASMVDDDVTLTRVTIPPHSVDPGTLR